MADTVNVGAISITIAGDSRNVEQASKRAVDALKGVEKTGSDAFSGINLKALAAATGITLAFHKIIDAIKQTIDQADDLGNLAQTLGIPVNALGELTFAAQRAHAQIGDLTTGIRILAQRMQDREELSQGALIFSQLGISVTDATGKMKTADQVILELADTFSKFQDGAAKTDLAMQLFGRTGASLIPLLNKGSAGIRALGEEGRKSGAVIDKDLAQTSAKFNDTLDRIRGTVSGLVTQLTKDMLPTLQSVADYLDRSTTASLTLEIAVDAVALAFKSIVTSGVLIITTLTTVAGVIATVGHALADLVTGQFQKLFNDLEQGGVSLGDQWQQTFDLVRGIWTDQMPKSLEEGGEKVKKAAVPHIATAQEIAKAWREAHLANQYAFEDLMNMDTKSAAQKITQLTEMVKSGAISWRQYQAAIQNVKDANKQQMSDLLNQTATTLTAIFQHSKTAAIASSLISTFSAITKALDTPPPMNFAMAALVAAQGFAQVANIRSTSQSGGGGGGHAGGGVAAAAAAAPAAPDRTLQVQGISATGLFTGDVVRDLAQKLLDFQKDGGRVLLSS